MVGVVGTCAKQDMDRWREHFKGHGRHGPMPHMNVSAFVMHTLLAKAWGNPSGCFCVYCRGEVAMRGGRVLACACQPLYLCAHCGARIIAGTDRASCLVCLEETCASCPPRFACECGDEGKGCEYCAPNHGAPWDHGPSGWTCLRPYPDDNRD